MNVTHLGVTYSVTTEPSINDLMGILQPVSFDYKRQAWIENGRYVRCGHPESMACNCYGRLHAGEIVTDFSEVR